MLAKFIRACLLINVNETIGSRHFDKKMLIDKERPREIRDLLMISGVFLLIPKNIYFFPFFFPSIEKIVDYNKYIYIVNIIWKVSYFFLVIFLMFENNLTSSEIFFHF